MGSSRYELDCTARDNAVFAERRTRSLQEETPEKRATL